MTVKHVRQNHVGIYMTVMDYFTQRQDRVHVYSVEVFIFCIFFNFQIRLNFLPVGHTHEDIDAIFGIFSKHLAQIDLYTIEGTHCYVYY